MTLFHTVVRSLRALGVPARARHVVVAVSGGADSMALLHLLHGLAPALNLRLTVAHLHHGLRGREADADARFVRAEARRLGWPCVVGRVRVEAAARAGGISREMAGREARYAFFVRVARRHARGDATVIATAHTADDQAETVLLRLARGTGARGLGGIPTERELSGGVRVIRPLLAVAREDLRVFLKQGGATWREDASNTDEAYLRNRVRGEVLPMLARTLNPRIGDALRRTADLLREDEAWMQAMTDAIYARVRRGDQTPQALDAAALAGESKAARRRVLQHWLQEAGVPAAVIDMAAVDAVDGLLTRRRGTGRCELGAGWSVARDYGDLRLERGREKPVAATRAHRLNVPGETLLPDWGLRVVTAAGKAIVRERGRVGRLPAIATISWGALKGRALNVRPWRPGDRIAPFGMTGSKKLQDVFVDAKVPPERRAGIPVLCCGDEIVWLPGYRIARRWTVNNPSARMLEIHVRSLRE
jgi:tRNA(Ile)-lysidine synthase